LQIVSAQLRIIPKLPMHFGKPVYSETCLDSLASFEITMRNKSNHSHH
jgi:hypothetical protein